MQWQHNPLTVFGNCPLPVFNFVPLRCLPVHSHPLSLRLCSSVPCGCPNPINTACFPVFAFTDVKLFTIQLSTYYTLVRLLQFGVASKSITPFFFICNVVGLRFILIASLSNLSMQGFLFVCFLIFIKNFHVGMYYFSTFNLKEALYDFFTYQCCSTLRPFIRIEGLLDKAVQSDKHQGKQQQANSKYTVKTLDTGDSPPTFWRAGQSSSCYRIVYFQKVQIIHFWNFPCDICTTDSSI